MTRLTVCGACGRMGSRILALAAEDKRFKIAGAVERAEHPLVGKAHLSGISVVSNLEKVIAETDVVIDFTSVTASLQTAAICAKTKVPLVIGTTGWDSQSLGQLSQTLKNVAFVQSPNMSLAVNLLYRLAAQAAAKLSSYDAEIIEIHHNQKKDAPSGTALRLAEELNKARGGKLKTVLGREGATGARGPLELGVLSLRGGDVLGDHTVILAGPGERLELTHRTHSRDTFARGALEAAAWIIKQKPGKYDMQDVLGL